MSFCKMHSSKRSGITKRPYAEILMDHLWPNGIAFKRMMVIRSDFQDSHHHPTQTYSMIVAKYPDTEFGWKISQVMRLGQMIQAHTVREIRALMMFSDALFKSGCTILIDIATIGFKSQQWIGCDKRWELQVDEKHVADAYSTSSIFLFQNMSFMTSHLAIVPTQFTIDLSDFDTDCDCDCDADGWSYGHIDLSEIFEELD